MDRILELTTPTGGGGGSCSGHSCSSLEDSHLLVSQFQWTACRRFPTNIHVVRMRTKVSSRINGRRIVIYLGAIILLSGGARALLEGWVSSPTEVPILAA
jgi:hypothetical protein